MKKMILMVLLVLGSGVNLSANYVAGYAMCDHPDNFKTIFIVKGKGSGKRTSTLAMAAFLNAEYPNEITKYCKSDTLYPNGYVFAFDSKAGANKQFSKWISDYKGESFIKK